MINAVFKQQYQTKYIEKYIELFVKAYMLIKEESLKIKKENNRRNQFVDKMRKIKSSFGITQAISNCDEFDEEYTTIGMTDISFIFGDYEDKKITFECKRFRDKTEINTSHIRNEYLEKGLARFVDGKYSTDFLVAGMVSFIENGDCEKCFKLLGQETKNDWIDESNHYLHNYIALSSHKTVNGKDFKVKHLVFDFTQ